ncbi:DUF6951 family protein [Methanolobus psychrotolerans]|uniref:DUF6951 family protein n=1 Tax=Methanolobus psychrotolerans TaxID=1874706 RepID=UPI000B917CE5|nr:hypothetical protein [Methanolobus psychrotolerans]
MVVTMSVESLCGYKTYVTAVTEGRKTHIHIETDCDKLKKWGCDFDLPNTEMSNQNIPYYELIMKSMKNSICENCYVPATVMNAYWVENEKVSKTLVKKIHKVEIFIEKIE